MSVPIRVLICDNDPEQLDTLRDEFEDADFLGSMVLEYASDITKAKRLIAEQYFDIAFVDLMFHPTDDEELGRDIIDHLRTVAPGCLKVLMTSYARAQYSAVFDTVSSSTGGKTFLLNKTDTSVTAQAATLVERFFKSRLHPAWNLELNDEVVLALEANLQSIQGLRSGFNAIADEVQSVLFQLFDDMATVPLANEPVTLDVSLLPSQGMTASVVARARPDYGKDRSGKPIYGNRCIVKIGPRESLVNEARRFNQLVKLSVPSEFRVELLGHASADSLAAICYSFAGGSQSDSIVSMDDLVRQSQSSTEAERVIRALFSPESRNWYSLVGKPVNLKGHYERAYNTHFRRNVNAVSGFLKRTWAPWVYDEDKHRVDFGGISFEVVQESDLGQAMFNARVSTCLIHGDLHGGNVMVDESGRISMIDFATVGFGPRFADGAAMGSTVRLIPLADQEAGPEELLRLGRMYKAERALLVKGSPRALESHRNSTWFRLSEALDNEIIRSALIEKGADEETIIRDYRRTQLVYCLNIFNLPHWSRAQKVRLLAWMCALRSVLVSQP